MFRLSRLHWDVVYHAATTMVMRPLVFSDGTGEIGPVSFQAARLCLEAHVACFNGFTGQAGVKVSEVDYADWYVIHSLHVQGQQLIAPRFLHLSSFTPFVIVFLHAVSAESNDDLKLLNRVVATLRQTRRVSRATDRLFRICDALARVAKVLVKSPDAEWEGGFYGETRDSLSFLDGLGQIVVHGGQGLSGPQTPGGSFIEGVGDLADFLNDWGAGVSPWMAFAGNGE